MYHWHCTLMAINPDSLSDHLVEIVQTTVSDINPEAGKMLTIAVDRLSDSKRSSISLMRGYDPDGEWSEELGPDGLPKSIHDCLSDFGVQSADELVKADRLKVNGVYSHNQLVAISPLICLGQFPNHSFEPWHWEDKRHAYTRECLLLGCSASEVARDLTPGHTARILNSVGEPLTNEKNTCDHIWGKWVTTADQFDLHKDQFKYECVCQVCRSRWQTVYLSAVSTKK